MVADVHTSLPVGRAVVCVITNLAGRAVSGRVDFADSGKLRIKPDARIIDWPSGERLKTDRGKLHITRGTSGRARAGPHLSC